MVFSCLAFPHCLNHHTHADSKCFLKQGTLPHLRVWYFEHTVHVASLLLLGPRVQNLGPQLCCPLPDAVPSLDLRIQALSYNAVGFRTYAGTILGGRALTGEAICPVRIQRPNGWDEVGDQDFSCIQSLTYQHLALLLFWLPAIFSYPRAKDQHSLHCVWNHQ